MAQSTCHSSLTVFTNSVTFACAAFRHKEFKQLGDMVRRADVKYSFTFTLCLSSCATLKILGTDDEPHSCPESLSEGWRWKITRLLYGPITDQYTSQVRKPQRENINTTSIDFSSNISTPCAVWSAGKMLFPPLPIFLYPRTLNCSMLT